MKKNKKVILNKNFRKILERLDARKLSKGSITTYKSIYGLYQDFLKGREPTIENAEEFIASKKELSKGSVNTYQMALRTYFRENDVEVPKKKLRAMKVNNIREDKFVTRKEVDKLYKCADSLRDKLIVRLLYHAGLRVKELRNLKVGDLDLDNGRINVRGIKGSHKVRSVRLIRPELAMPTINAYIKSRGLDPKSFKDKDVPLIWGRYEKQGIGYKAIFNMIKSLGTCIKKYDLSPHWLRHAFVVWNKVHDVPPEITAKQIGDTVETTVKIYSHYNKSDVDRVYDKIQGKIPDEDDEVRNPIDEIDELREKDKALEDKLAKLVKKQELIDDILLRAKIVSKTFYEMHSLEKE